MTSDDLVARLRADALHHKQVACDCDCRPMDTVNWGHALNCLEAADEIERLRNQLAAAQTGQLRLERNEDYQREPSLPDDQWIERFVTHMKALAEKCAAPDFLAEMDSYARETAPTYLETRKEYVSPEEAAETDVSYWESEE